MSLQKLGLGHGRPSLEVGILSFRPLAPRALPGATLVARDATLSGRADSVDCAGSADSIRHDMVASPRSAASRLQRRNSLNSVIMTRRNSLKTGAHGGFSGAARDTPVQAGSAQSRGTVGKKTMGRLRRALVAQVSSAAMSRCNHSFFAIILSVFYHECCVMSCRTQQHRVYIVPSPGSGGRSWP